MALVTKISNILCPEVRQVETSITGGKTIGALERLRKVLREGVRSFIVENDYAYVAEVRLEVFLQVQTMTYKKSLKTNFLISTTGATQTLIASKVSCERDFPNLKAFYNSLFWKRQEQARRDQAVVFSF